MNTISIFDDTFHGMYTDEGNLKVHEHLEKCKELLETSSLKVVRRTLWDGVNTIAKKFPEVYDTDVRYNLAYELKKHCESKNIPYKEDSFDY